MAEPASLVIGVVALTVQAVQATKALLALGLDIRGAPGDIKAINKEVHDFYNVIFSLNLALKDQEVQAAISGNKILLETVASLNKPLNNCQAIVGQLSVKLERLRNSGLESRARPSFTGVKWSLVSKNEIRKFQQRLQSEKITISMALNVINIPYAWFPTVGRAVRMTSMRVLNLVEENRVVNTSTATLQFLAPRACDHSDLGKIVEDIEVTYMSMKRISECLKKIVQSTQSAVMSADHLLHREVARVYQDLSKADTQIRQLRSSTARFQEIRERMTSAASNHDTRTSKFEDLDSRRRNDLDNSDAAVIEVFFDCVSRFSSGDSRPSSSSSSSIEELQVNFFGAPEYRFELLPSFYPEQYTSDGSISEQVFAVAMLATDDQHTFRYFLHYAETARHWKRVVVFAAFHGECQQTDALRVASSHNHMWGAPEALPVAVHRLLRTILPFIEFYSTITRIGFDLKMGDNGQITARSPRLEVIEDESEMSVSDEREFLRYVDSVCSKQYVESDVITYSRINATSYKVYVDSQACCERKVLFARGRAQGRNAFLDYLEEIKHRISLRGCASVSEFRGIVLDDTRRHLRSYLLELPMFSSLGQLLALANSRSTTIPWPIRELWARQLIQAIIEIHSQGLIAGVFNIHSMGIRADGTAVFHRFQRSEDYIHQYRGQAPPEIRNRHHRNDHPGSVVRVNLNFQTDIFQLGFALWQLLEHVPRDMGRFCARAACTHVPRTTLALLTFATSSEIVVSQIHNPGSQQGGWITFCAPVHRLIILQPRSRKH
ncbi:MAG: hypothetical protein M1816_006487 [Peltula sp. TS41687]|nr:MAG: hypothetical protein M1816_006487 [Peltula sp. TS41687]